MDLPVATRKALMMTDVKMEVDRKIVLGEEDFAIQYIFIYFVRAHRENDTLGLAILVGILTLIGLLTLVGKLTPAGLYNNPHIEHRLKHTLIGCNQEERWSLLGTGWMLAAKRGNSTLGQNTPPP